MERGRIKKLPLRIIRKCYDQRPRVNDLSGYALQINAKRIFNIASRANISGSKLRFRFVANNLSRILKIDEK